MGTMNWEGKKERRKVLQASSFSPPPPFASGRRPQKDEMGMARTKRAADLRFAQLRLQKAQRDIAQEGPPFSASGSPQGAREGGGEPAFPPGVPGSLSGSPPGARKLPAGVDGAPGGSRLIRPWQPVRGSRRQSFRGPIRGPPRATAGSHHRSSGPIRPQDSGPKGGRGRARPRASPLTPQRFRLQLGFGGFIIWMILSLFGDVSFP